MQPEPKTTLNGTNGTNGSNRTWAEHAAAENGKDQGAHIHPRLAITCYDLPECTSEIRFSYTTVAEIVLLWKHGYGPKKGKNCLQTYMSSKRFLRYFD